MNFPFCEFFKTRVRKNISNFCWWTTWKPNQDDQHGTKSARENFNEFEKIEEQNRVFWCVKFKIERCESFLHMQMRTNLQLDRLICRTRQKYFDFVQYQWRKKKFYLRKRMKNDDDTKDTHSTADTSRNAQLNVTTHSIYFARCRRLHAHLKFRQTARETIFKFSRRCTDTTFAARDSVATSTAEQKLMLTCRLCWIWIVVGITTLLISTRPTPDNRFSNHATILGQDFHSSRFGSDWRPRRSCNNMTRWHCHISSLDCRKVHASDEAYMIRVRMWTRNNHWTNEETSCDGTNVILELI